MKNSIRKRMIAAMIGAAMCASLTGGYSASAGIPFRMTLQTTAAASTLDDMPAEYRTAAEWIWQNRCVAERSTERWNTLFDQLIAGKGTLNYVVKWQSYKTITLEQRQKMEVMLSDCVNAWNDRLAGYDGWPYDHIDVKIVGWAVIDAASILDPQPDEIIYTDTKYYDSQYDTSNGVETIPDKEPYAPDELSRMYHFEHRLEPGFNAFQYPGGLDKRFDMYMWATEGFPAIGGCGGDWGQRLSDTAYLNMLDGSNLHVQEHEVGHAFGITDFYGGEGESDGFPPGGFPGNGTSIMMAGSSAVITDFDGWLLRYIWSQIKNESGRFDLGAALPDPTEPETQPSTEPETQPQTEPETQPDTVQSMEFADGMQITLKNAASEQFLGVENKKAFNMANVLQSGTKIGAENVWTLRSAGEGYYYLYSALEGGETYLLDVYYALTENGTNVGVYENTGSPAQLFRFVDNGDGTIRILTAASGDASCVQISEGSANGNAEEWVYDGSPAQHWILSEAKLAGYKGDLNGDGQVDTADVQKMQAYLLARESLADIADVYKDMNEDGKCNVFDLILLKRAANHPENWTKIYQ